MRAHVSEGASIENTIEAMTENELGYCGLGWRGNLEGAAEVLADDLGLS